MKKGDFIVVTKWASRPAGKLWAVVIESPCNGATAEIKFIKGVGDFALENHDPADIYDNDTWCLESDCDEWKVVYRVPNYVLAQYTKLVLLGELTIERSE